MAESKKKDFEELTAENMECYEAFAMAVHTYAMFLIRDRAFGINRTRELMENVVNTEAIQHSRGFYD